MTTTDTNSQATDEPVKKKIGRILVVDDEPGICDLLSYELSSQGYDVLTASNGEEALELVKKDRFNVIVSDMKMPKMDGLETLDAVKKVDPDVEVIMATGYGTIETAVTAMKSGAYDFIQKPFSNIQEVFALVEKAMEKRELKALLAVYEVSKAVFTSVKLHDLLPVIIGLSKRILRADEVSIMLAEPDGALKVAAYIGADDDPRRGAPDGRPPLSPGDRVAGKVALSKEPAIIVGPLEKDPRFQGVPSLRRIKSSIVYPLVLENQVLGVLNANRIQSDAPFTQSDMQSVTIFCSQIAQAVYNARLYEQLDYEQLEDKVKRLDDAYRRLEETQQQLLQTEKLAAIGQLAAGVAHELNNPLTGILGFAQLLLQEEGLNAQQREDLESIYKQSQRCRQIIQNLLQFSHRKEPKKEAIQLAPLLEQTLQLVQYEFKTSGVDIIRTVAEDLPPVFGDPNQLQQVFLNLLTNARQAMEGRKKDARITIDGKRQAGKAVLTFQDNGTGISAENLSKIFDPFFTTKPVGKGTGLGLSITYGIVQQHKGTIRADSHIGQGTTFIIELPAHVPEQES
jgi:signal transduction histidine kinase/ActR/RegA family two-component response regulator